MFFEFLENLNFRGRFGLMVILDKGPELGKGVFHFALEIKAILFCQFYYGKVVF